MFLYKRATRQTIGCGVYIEAEVVFFMYAGRQHRTILGPTCWDGVSVLDDCYDFYLEYARAVGFSIKRYRSDGCRYPVAGIPTPTVARQGLCSYP